MAVRFDLIRGQQGEHSLKLRFDRFPRETAFKEHFGERHGLRGLLFDSRRHFDAFVHNMQARMASGEVTDVMTHGAFKVLLLDLARTD